MNDRRIFETENPISWLVNGSPSLPLSLYVVHLRSEIMKCIRIPNEASNLCNLTFVLYYKWKVKENNNEKLDKDKSWVKREEKGLMFGPTVVLLWLEQEFKFVAEQINFRSSWEAGQTGESLKRFLDSSHSKTNHQGYTRSNGWDGSRII